MANQWGRDANLQSGGSRSSFGLIILFFVALFVGMAGGYGGFRLLSGVSSDEIATRDARIAELEKTVTELKFATESSKSDDNVQSEALDLLRTRLAKANQTIEALRNAADASADATASKLKADLAAAQDKIAALEDELQSADDASGTIDRLQKSQRVAERQILDLERQLADATTANEQLAKQLAARSDNLDQAARQRIKTLEDANKALSGTLESEGRASRAKIASLEDQVAELTATVDGTSLALTRAKADIAAKAMAMTALNEDKDKLTRDLAALKGQVKDLMAQLAKAGDGTSAAAQATIDALKADKQAAEAALSDMKDKMASAQGRIDKLKADKARLEATIVDLQAQLAVKPVDPGNDGQNTDQPQNDGKPQLEARDPALVDRALSRMPALDRLDADRQATLRAKLEDGACVTDSLEAVFDRVPVLALRNLIRDLKSPC